MQIGDFVGVKFPNDNKVYFAEVKNILPGDEFECRFVHSGSVYTFKKYPDWLEVAETTGAFKPGTRTSDVTLYEETDDHISLDSNVGLTFDDGNSYLGIAEKTDPTLDIKFLHSGNSYSIDYDNIAHRAGGTYDGRKVLVRRTYAPGKSLFSSDVALGTGAGALLVLVERIGSGWFRFAWNRDVQEDEVGPFLFEGGTPSGIEITKEASGAFLVSGIRSEMIYDQQIDQRLRREIVPKLLNAPDGKPPVTSKPVFKGQAPGVGVEMDENAVLEWVHGSLEGTHYLAGVAEVVETLHTSGGLAAVAGTSLASVVGGIASYIIMLWAVVRAIGIDIRLQEQEGFCYGVMWETSNKPNGDRVFLPLGHSAEDTREAFFDGVGQGRQKAKDVKVHNRVMLAVGYYMVKGSNEEWAQFHVLNDLWKKVRETDKGWDTLTWPNPQKMWPLIPD